MLARRSAPARFSWPTASTPPPRCSTSRTVDIAVLDLRIGDQRSDALALDPARARDSARLHQRLPRRRPARVARRIADRRQALRRRRAAGRASRRSAERRFSWNHPRVAPLGRCNTTRRAPYGRGPQRETDMRRTLLATTAVASMLAFGAAAQEAADPAAPTAAEGCPDRRCRPTPAVDPADAPRWRRDRPRRRR